MGVNHGLIPAHPADPGASPGTAKAPGSSFGKAENPEEPTQVELQKFCFPSRFPPRPWRKEMPHPKFLAALLGGGQVVVPAVPENGTRMIPARKGLPGLNPTVESANSLQIPNNSPLNVAFPWICPTVTTDPLFPTVSTRIQNLEAPERGNIPIFPF